MIPFSALRPTEKGHESTDENFILINLGQKKLCDTLYLFFDVYVFFSLERSVTYKKWWIPMFQYKTCKLPSHLVVDLNGL